MSIIKGSATYTRFFVDGEAPDLAALEMAVDSRRFMPLSPDMEASESAGWVRVEDPMGDDVAITRGDFTFGSLIVLAYREDAYRIPPAQVKAAVRKRLNQIREEEDREPTRAIEKAVKESVIAELKRKAFPRSRIVECVWDLGTNAVRIFAKGALCHERAATLLERTCKIALEQGSYPARALESASAERTHAVLQSFPIATFPEVTK